MSSSSPSPSNPPPSNLPPSNPLPSNPLPSNPLPSNPLPSNPLPSNPPPSSQPIKAFKLFHHLPIEVRFRIWKWAEPGSSIMHGAIWVCPNVDLARPARAFLISPRDFDETYSEEASDSDDDSDDVSESSDEYPIYILAHEYMKQLETPLNLLHTCREARGTILDVYTLIGCHSPIPSDTRLWRPEDVLFFPLDFGIPESMHSTIRWRMLFKWMTQSGGVSRKFAALEHIAIPFEVLKYSHIYSIWKNTPGAPKLELIDQFLANFPHLQRLMIVKDPVTVSILSGGSFVLCQSEDVPLKDRDRILDPPKTPSELEQEITQLLQESAARSDSSRKVPVVEFSVLCREGASIPSQGFSIPTNSIWRSAE